jgi:phytoene/squalene synthetase
MQYCKDPVKARLVAMYGLLASLEDCLIRASDPAISRAKLIWWSDELRQARGKSGTHPVTIRLRESGALASWPPDLTDRLLHLSLNRVEPNGLADEGALRTLCEEVGKVHLELEASLYGGDMPDLAEMVDMAVIQGFTQILRETFQAKRTSFYWLPLTYTARFGFTRAQIAANPAGSDSRQMIMSMLELLMDWVEAVPVKLRNYQGSSGACVADIKHSSIVTALQLRQIARLQKALGSKHFKGDIANVLLSVKVSDGWAAWRLARRLHIALEDGKA